MNTSPVTEPILRLASTRTMIVGLGLMGGSLALALRGQCTDLIGVDTDPQTCEFALKNGIVDDIADINADPDCDLLVLAMPVQAILAYLHRLNERAASNRRATIVIDLGSTKTEIGRAMQSLPTCFDPVGGHPMCGKEVSGVIHAEAVLYQGRAFVLTPLERTSRAALTMAYELVATIGAKPLLLSMEEHDALAAVASHLPYVLACALMCAAQSQNNQQVWELAASGFRDTSRLAASDLTMMVDILLTNRGAILDAVRNFRTELDTLTTLIDSGDEQGLYAALEPVARQRTEMFK